VGNWFDAVSIILERLGAGRAVTVWPTIKNNYLGGGDRVAALLTAAIVSGDILCEVRSALRCLARDPARALATLDELESGLLQEARKGMVATGRELARMAHILAEVPRRARPEQTPKVLLFGGVNRIFVNGPVRDFFEERGILTKTTDVSEFLSLLESEPVVRCGLARGETTPTRQMAWSSLLLGTLRDRDVRNSVQVLRGRVHCAVIESMEKRFRRLLAPSGLLFTPHIPFMEVLEGGHQHVALNSFSEVPFTVGRYVAALQSGAFDGFVNVGAFNCAPANLATAVIRALAGRSDIPYAVVEADGSSITAGQLRQLETVAAQCRRRRADHGGLARTAPEPDARSEEPARPEPDPRRAAAGMGTETDNP
jgi:predicted nucleotide-binding protein (sugar kinase/HSP70/actin superfamily)